MNDLKKEILSSIKPIILKIPWLAAVFAGASFFIMAAFLQIIVNVIIRPTREVTYLNLFIAFVISMSVALLGAFLVKRRAETKMIKNLEGKGLDISRKDLLKFSDIIKEE